MPFVPTKDTFHDVLYLFPLATINGELTGQDDPLCFNSSVATVTKLVGSICIPKTLKTQPTILHKGILDHLFTLLYL